MQASEEYQFFSTSGKNSTESSPIQQQVCFEKNSYYQRRSPAETYHLSGKEGDAEYRVGVKEPLDHAKFSKLRRSADMIINYNEIENGRHNMEEADWEVSKPVKTERVKKQK